LSGEEKMAAKYQVHLTNGRFDGSVPADLHALLAAAGDRLYVYFHGGLVDRAAGTQGADALHAAWMREGATGVHIVWHSGLREVIAANLGEIAKDLLFVRLRKQLARFVLAKLEEVAGGRAPGMLELPDLQGAEDQLYAAPARVAAPLIPMQEDQLEAALRRDDRLSEAVDAIARAVEPDGARDPATARRALVDARIRDAIRSERGTRGDRGLVTWTVVVRTAVAIVGRVLARLRSGHDHGPYVTLVEEILRGIYLDIAAGMVWTAMKKDTADAFGDGLDFGGTALIEELRAWWKPGRRVVLIGHSTGAVYIFELIDAFVRRFPDAQADLRFDVVFLAGAVTFDRLERSWQAWEARVHRFLSVGLSDQRERDDHLVGPLYPASLLYFVSGVAESDADTPLVGMERYWTNSIYRALPGVSHARGWIGPSRRLVWASDGDTECAARHHGDVDDDDVTRATVASFLREA
jgi:hypothetical protein